MSTEKPFPRSLDVSPVVAAIVAEHTRVKAIAAELADALRAALPVLERAATEEARANRAPTGAPRRDEAGRRLAAAHAAIAKAGEIK